MTKIGKSSRQDQWNYINTKHNSEDHGSSSVLANLLKDSNWFTGPAFLTEPEEEEFEQPAMHYLQHPETDVEVCPEVTTYATNVTGELLGSHWFERFFNWKSITCTTARLIQKARAFSKTSDSSQKKDELLQARLIILKSAQHDSFKEEIKNLAKAEEV